MVTISPLSFNSPTPKSGAILLMNETKNAALPPPQRFANVSTIGFASYLASAESPLQRFSRTGLALKVQTNWLDTNGLSL